MISLLAVIDPLEHQPLRIFLYFVITLGLIAGSWLIVRRVRDYELVFLGLLVAAAAIGYGMLGFAGGEMKVGGDAAGGAAGFSFGAVLGGGGLLMKIAVLLVVAGVARNLLLLTWPGAAPAETPKN